MSKPIKPDEFLLIQADQIHDGKWIHDKNRLTSYYTYWCQQGNKEAAERGEKKLRAYVNSYKMLGEARIT